MQKSIRVAFDRLRSYVYGDGGEFKAVPCLYCGLPSKDEEHVVPHSFLKHLRDTGYVREEVLVPSCRECNLIASNNVFDSYEDKYDYIHCRLRDKYRKVLEMPEWTQSELMALGPRLKRYMRSQLRLKALILDRLAWNPNNVLTVDEKSKLIAHGSVSAATRVATNTTSIAVTGL